tara:strand:+ start:4303 stop:4542 length:240 start_codon:yes stop_codon:yes gene_type:complete
MKRYIHVNQHKIRSNSKNGTRDPVITCKSYKDNQYGHSVVIYDKYGEEACRVVYSPDKPLSCGARVYIVTENEVSVEAE